MNDSKENNFFRILRIYLHSNYEPALSYQRIHCTKYFPQPASIDTLSITEQTLKETQR